MAHDFLASFHSEVMPHSPKERQAKAQASSENTESVPVSADDRHRTVGVSMSPKLHQLASQRARSLGLPLSRYVQWCIEAELAGQSLGDRFKL